MGRYSHRADLHRHFARDILCRPNMVNEQESLISWLLTRHTPHHARSINTEVGIGQARFEKGRQADSLSFQDFLLAWRPLRFPAPLASRNHGTGSILAAPRGTPQPTAIWSAA